MLPSLQVKAYVQDPRSYLSHSPNNQCCLIPSFSSADLLVCSARRSLPASSPGTSLPHGPFDDSTLMSARAIFGTRAKTAARNWKHILNADRDKDNPYSLPTVLKQYLTRQEAVVGGRR